MTGTGTERYGERMFSHGHDAELDRLHGLAGALDDGSFRRLARLPIREDWRCLDIGAGLGTVTRWLARRCPRGRVVAMDRDIRLLSVLDDRTGWEAVESDVTREDFPAGGFDLIHARWLFAHLPSRDAVLERVVRWLAPGGWLVIEDLARFPLESSPHPLYRKVSLAICDAVINRIGTDPAWARTFPAPLRPLGLTDLGSETSLPAVGPTPMGRFWRRSGEQLAADLTGQLGITEAELAEFGELVESPDFHDLCLATVAAWGRRPE
ncbi:class I SAM-dependent methyltransferase [Kibdelosporangium aridum]|uniref:Methyltransferase domain-containing protein n=1 Tax=Kibdelosporangium aridum TaxID=2030 RepID=A0A1W2FYN7_KIBAR|nr:class I SAM-dependent methyltransferase [Kibdelosporangium aridum]SMD27050.1 Methyltransferase domain-containing protein [Kibdelosporangium aridum]